MTYAELLQTRSREQADIWLKIHRKQYEWHKGKLQPRLKPPDDPPLVDITSPSHPCRQCGERVYRKGAKYCGRACLGASMKKSRPGCRRCGAEVKEHDHKYCSLACRHRRIA